MSMKRLQDLLNTNPSAYREHQRVAHFDNRVLQHAPMGQFPIPTNTGHTPLVNANLRSLAQAQSIFYDPLPRNEGNAQLNPIFQQLFNNMNNNNPMYYSQSQFEQENTLGLGSHNTRSEMLTSLTSILEAVKMSQIDPPKTLNELLQKSSTVSTHSNSLPQSPFMSSHSHASPMNAGYGGYMSSPYANQILHSDYSLLSTSVLATPIQTPQQNFRPQQMAPPQSTNNNNNMNEILLQLTSLLKRDDGGNLREAIAQLIGGQPNPNPSQTRDNFSQQTHMIKLQRGLNQNFGQKELPDNQRTIPLSNGFTMNSLNRNHRFAEPQRIGIMQRDIMASVSSRRGGDYSVIPEEDSGMQLDHSISQERPEPFNLNMIRPPSPNQSLNRKLNGLNLNGDTTEETKEMSFSLGGGLAIGHELSMIFNERLDPEGEVPGTYTRDERTGKILKYKNKIRKWRHEHPITRKFKGRSVVAGKKPRIKGKFVSLDEYVEYIKTNNESDPQAQELFNEISTYVESEKSARDVNVKDENF